MAASWTLYLNLLTFGIAQGDELRAGDAARQCQPDGRAAVANHDFVEQLMHLLDVARHEFVAPIHELPLERARGAQQPWLQQCD